MATICVKGVRMTQPSSASRPRGRADTRERLLQAVGELRDERGWTACSLQAVARRAGLTTGAVYSTFGSRGALLAAWMVRRVERFGLPRDESDLTDAVAAFARGYYSQTQSAEGLELVTMQLDLVRLAATDPPLAEALREGFEQLLDELIAGLEARGAEAAGLTTAQLARRLVGVLQGLLIQKIGFAAPVSEQDFIDAALAAIGASPR
jgi:AcrR family transcriptional regulator